MRARFAFEWSSCVLAIALLLSTARCVNAGPTIWKRIALVTQSQRDAGISPGGEGGQWPRGPLAITPADPDFLLLPIDVGGLYRSLDAGRTWQSSMVGWNARGANGFAIDPRNADRVIGIAGNSTDWNNAWGRSPHGLYLSTDKAASWSHVLIANDSIGGRVAFDPTSYDAERGHCTRAFYFSGAGLLFISRDGGSTWDRLENAPDVGTIAGGDWTSGHEAMPSLAVSPANGTIFLAGQTGVYRSPDQGLTWTGVRDTPTISLATSSTGDVLISDGPKLWRSSDAGTTWSPIAAHGLETGDAGRVQGLAISSADPRRILCWVARSSFNWPRFVSHDGGGTFTAVTTESDGAFLPMNARQGHFVWDAQRPNIAYSLGGDWVTKSTDGGRTFQWSNNGYGGIMVGGGFAFSATTPDVMFIGFQDYNGARTDNGGRTWTYADVSGNGWGGHAYGGFALNRQTMWAGSAEGWSSPRRLRITHDGGNSWAFATDAAGEPLELRGADVSAGDPRNDQIAFAGALRTADGGVTWQQMPNCDGVFDAAGDTLYGRNKGLIVRSQDSGASWTELADAPGDALVDDVAAGPANGEVFVAAGDRLHRFHQGEWTIVDVPVDQFGHVRVTTVAADPTERRILYVGSRRDIHTTTTAVCRSTDGGQTWDNLTTNAPLSPEGGEGPREVSWIRVHPQTREAWVAGSCFGLWRLAPPLGH